MKREHFIAEQMTMRKVQVSSNGMPRCLIRAVT